MEIRKNLDKIFEKNDEENMEKVEEILCEIIYFLKEKNIKNMNILSVVFMNLQTVKSSVMICVKI